MAGVSMDSGGGGRKSVDQSINMVPMIDLLISVIAFLLMTAVWVTVGALRSTTPGKPGGPIDFGSTDKIQVEIQQTGFRIVRGDGAHVVDVPAGEDAMVSLRTALLSENRSLRLADRVFVHPESQTDFNRIAQVMSVIYDVWSELRGVPGSQAVSLSLM